MLRALQVLTLLLVAVTMALALAHALELPGKLRLSREAYAGVQPIYYPGFTWGGACEPAAFIALAILLLLTPTGPAFWLILAAFLALGAMHGAYWLLTHPVNGFWLRDLELNGFAAKFFRFDPMRRTQAAPDWTAMRDRWEYSNVLRAALGMLSLACLAVAVAL